MIPVTPPIPHLTDGPFKGIVPHCIGHPKITHIASALGGLVEAAGATWG